MSMKDDLGVTLERAHRAFEKEHKYRPTEVYFGSDIYAQYHKLCGAPDGLTGPRPAYYFKGMVLQHLPDNPQGILFK